MGRTTYTLQGDNFLINGEKTYTELTGSDERVQGLLFNARFIQGIFEDKNPDNKGKYDRFGKVFDPDRHTAEMIERLPEWYKHGIRAITVGMQGGGPIFTYEDWSVIDTATFSPDGKTMNPDYQRRLGSVLKACDELGILVIVSVLYQAQAHLLEDGVALVEAVKTTCEFLTSLPYNNVIIEVANEYDVGDFSNHPVISSPECMANLICLAREWSGNRFAVGASGGGGTYHKIVAQYSDVILLHGNNLRPEEYARMIRRAKEDFPDKPVVCNEDSPLYDQLTVSLHTHTSWGYYNDFTKQEPPAFWGIRQGEDRFFADRLLDVIYGNPIGENAYYLEGLEADSAIEGRHYVKLAARYPKQIDYVEFFEDDKLLGISYDAPFLLYSMTTWEQAPYIPAKSATTVTAKVHLVTGNTHTCSVPLQTN